MSYDAQRDKIDTAKDYLLRYSPNSQEFEAAAEHLNWVLKNDKDAAPAARSALLAVVEKRKAEASLVNALLEIIT
jgi:hypothetical protein